MRRRDLGLWVTLVFFACGSPQAPAMNPGQGTPPTSVAGTATDAADGEPPGLVFSLQKGKSAPEEKTPQARNVAGVKVSDAEGDALLRKLPALPSEKNLESDFAKRAATRPPPSVYKETLTEFPAEAKAAAKPAEKVPLEVLRIAPEGDVPFAPELTVTFNQPMIALSSHAESVAGGVPAKLTPQPPGKWRWLGTRTLAFTPQERFPMATEYTVEVAAGTKSADGTKLAKAVRATFQTPAPKLEESYPLEGGAKTKLQPVVALRFDQAIDREALVKQARFCAARKQCVSARIAKEEELALETQARDLIKAAQDASVQARTIAFLPVEALPYDAHITVELGKVPSAEGPRRGEPLNVGLQTHGPFKVVGSDCGYGGKCVPNTPWIVKISNPVNLETLDVSAFHVEPEAEILSIQEAWAEGSSAFSVEVAAKPRTKYKLTVPGTVGDVFGQTLGKEQVLSFSVGDPEPVLYGGDILNVLDPDGPRALEVVSAGIQKLNTVVQRVEPKDFTAFAKYLQDLNQGPAHLPGKKVGGGTLSLEHPEEITTTRVDITSALSQGLGHAIVVVEPTSWPQNYKPAIRTWVQATDIGLDVFQDPNSLYVWASRLSDGKPLEGVSISLAPDGANAKTDAQGFVRLDLPEGGGKSGRVVIAQHDADVAFYPERTWGGDYESEWRKRKSSNELRWFVFDDRGAYRPGERVYLKGWVRTAQGGVVKLPAGLSTVNYVVTSSNGHELTKGVAKLSAQGGFDVSFALPGDVDLGYTQVHFETSGQQVSGAFDRGIQVLEFRRPEYEVSLKVEEALPFVGDQVHALTQARYYTGGPLAGAPTNLEVGAERAQFSPPNRSEYQFGEPIFWHFWSRPRPEPMLRMEHLTGNTDAEGRFPLDINLTRAEPAYPYTLRINTSVQDVNRQTWSDSKSVLVHPSNTYVGVRAERGFVALGEELDLRVVTVDLDGKDVQGRAVEVRGVRHEFVTNKGKTTEREVDVQTCSFHSDGQVHRCTFKPSAAGVYEIRARVLDERGRPNDTRVSTYVTGPSTSGPENVQAQVVEIIPDKKEYAPGDTANVLLYMPFYPASAVIMVGRNGVVSKEQVEIQNATHTVRIPISKDQAPNLTVLVTLAGKRKLKAAENREVPAFAQGTASLSITLKEKRLGLTVTPDAAELEPGSKSGISVKVLDPNGQPTKGAEITLVVVDEAVLALTGYDPGDPINAFFPPVDGGIGSFALRPLIKIPDPNAREATRETVHRGRARSGRAGGGLVLEKAMAMSAPAPMAEGMAADRAVGQANGPAPTMRADFSPIALFAAQLTSDASGVAKSAVKLPDDLTRYRIFAVASAGQDFFGRGESTITARKQLMVRPSAPRFLNFGDSFELPIVVENASGAPQSVLVAARASNVSFADGRARRVEVPAHDRVEVRLPMNTRMAGTALLQVAAQSKTGADAAQISLPVWTPATDEAFATYGTLSEDGAVAQPLKVPSDVYNEFGGLEISTTSTQIAALTDALLYLYEYPFECSEQLASRMMTLLALRDVIAAFGVADVPSPEEVKESIAASTKKLLDLQNGDGGFPWWERGRESAAYNTIHVLHALVRARMAGVKNLDQAIERARNAAPELIARTALDAKGKRALKAYLHYVTALFDPSHGQEIDALYREAKPNDHSVETLGFILSAATRSKASDKLLKDILVALSNRASETASTAQFTDHYTDEAHVLLHSDQRSDAVALEGLVLAAKDHDLTTKVAKGLLAHRKKGRWLNTQENVFSALALRVYFDEFEKETPSFEARAFLGNLLAQSARYDGRTTKQTTTNVPMATLAKQGKAQVVVEKTGKGRLYYRLGLRYAPKSLTLAPEDQGFTVERTYEGVDDPKDVTRDASGVWYVKAGARVRVTISMVAKARRYHVALVDPLAAGFEPMQSALRVMAPQTPNDPNVPCKHCDGRRIWWGPWYEHENLRDERAEAFSSLVSAGVYQYTYNVRATTPGTFVVPPAKAEEMYMPETFGRTATDRVIVR